MLTKILSTNLAIIVIALLLLAFGEENKYTWFITSLLICMTIMNIIAIFKYVNNNHKITKINGKDLDVSFSKKVSAILDVGGVLVSAPSVWKEGLICVEDTGKKSYAYYISDIIDMQSMLVDDGILRQWIYLPNAKEYV